MKMLSDSATGRDGSILRNGIRAVYPCDMFPYETYRVDPKVKSVLRLIPGWAIYELPEQILDPANDEKIKRGLKLFQRSLIMIDQQNGYSMDNKIEEITLENFKESKR